MAQTYRKPFAVHTLHQKLCASDCMYTFPLREMPRPEKAPRVLPPCRMPRSGCDGCVGRIHPRRIISLGSFGFEDHEKSYGKCSFGFADCYLQALARPSLPAQAPQSGTNPSLPAEQNPFPTPSPTGAGKAKIVFKVKRSRGACHREGTGSGRLVARPPPRRIFRIFRRDKRRAKKSFILPADPTPISIGLARRQRLEIEKMAQPSLRTACVAVVGGPEA